MTAGSEELVLSALAGIPARPLLYPTAKRLLCRFASVLRGGETEPLQASGDTDALDALVASDDGGAHAVTVTFPYEGCGVPVERSGVVEVYDEPFTSH